MAATTGSSTGSGSGRVFQTIGEAGQALATLVQRGLLVEEEEEGQNMDEAALVGRINAFVDALQEKPQTDVLCVGRVTVDNLVDRVVSFSDQRHAAALHVAAGANACEVVGCLLENGAHVNLTMGYAGHEFDGDTAAHFAARADAVDALEVLFRNGANLRITGNQNRSVAAAARSESTRRKVEELNEESMDPLCPQREPPWSANDLFPDREPDPQEPDDPKLEDGFSSLYGGGRGGLLAGIRGGVSLRSTHQPTKSARKR